MSRNPPPRRVCFVTGTRAEFGLMESTLRAISQIPSLKLQIVATGMHLDRAHGRSIDQIRKAGWTVDATVPWPAARDAVGTARAMGLATAGLAAVYERLASDIVLVVGDRVEAFAAAAAGHVGRRVVAHVHGGDRAEGQVDDSLRHAITKLAHVHFPATVASAERIRGLGEDAWRIHRVGSPGIDGIREECAKWDTLRARYGDLPRRGYALVLLHPTDPSEAVEKARARMVYRSVRSAGVSRVILVWPNNDPGSKGIVGAWEGVGDEAGVGAEINLPRPIFLGLMRHAAMLVGNSSSGIIEAASFGTPVIDVGDRQRGRERGENVTTVPFGQAAIRAAVGRVWNEGKPMRFAAKNLYGRGDTGRRIARRLAGMAMGDRVRRKLIAY